MSAKLYTLENVRRDAKPADEAASEAVVDFGRLLATVEYAESLKAIVAKNHKRDLRLMRERDALADALRAMLDAEPYASDAEDCECGDWDEAAAREDMAPTCRHTKAHVALAAISKALRSDAEIEGER